MPFSDRFVAKARVTSLNLLQRPGGNFRRCYEPDKRRSKLHAGIDQTELGAKALRLTSTADDSTIVPFARDEGIE